MSLFNYLERVLGGVSSYYDMLMKSRKEQTSYTPADVDFIADRLQNIKRTATFISEIDVNKSSRRSNENNVLLDSKLQPLPHIFDFKIRDHFYSLYCNTEKAIRDDKYHSVVPLDKDLLSPGVLILGAAVIEGYSLPIWEELVHRNKEINGDIKSRAPENPWSLYSVAKRKALIGHQYKLQIDGYPQWLINDVDFRKIKKLEFLCELKLSLNCSIYYFKDLDLDEIIFFKQRL